MTPFMHQVQELLDGGPTSSPQTLPSESVTVAHGADVQVLIRSLAEQLVSEANAILVDTDRGVIALTDETGPGALALAAGALAAIAIPAIYLLFPPDDARGFNSEFAADLTGAHWVAVAVWVLLALAVSRASRPRRADGRADAGAGSERP